MSAPPTLRADAQRNRDAIVTAARTAFAEHGLVASLDDIAKCAGVGSGTLYRHFANRDELVTAVFAERMTENVAAVEHAQRNPDPWAGFCEYVRYACRAQAVDRGLADLIAIGHRSEDLAALRVHIYDGLITLVNAAQRAEALRADVTAEDVVLLMMANVGIVERAGPVACAASERFVALALDGFRTEGASPAPAPPAPEAMFAALRMRTDRKLSGERRAMPAAGGDC